MPPTSLTGAPSVTDGYVGAAPDMPGKSIDNSQTTPRTGGTFYRQRVNVSDPADPDAHAGVLATDPTPTDYGLTVRAVPGGADARATHELLFLILQELQALNAKLDKVVT